MRKRISVSGPNNRFSWITKAAGKGSFISDLFHILTGTGIAQVIAVISMPILVRFYTPEEFGTLALFVSTSGILTVIACLRYELAIVLPETKEDAANLLVLSLFFIGITSLFVSLLVSNFGSILVVWLRAPKFLPYLWLLPFANLAGGIYQVISYWNTRVRRFDRSSSSRVANSVVTLGTQVGMGVFGKGGTGSLIGGMVLGSFASSVLIAFWLVKEEWRFFARSVTLNQMFILLKRYKKFPLLSLWSGVLNTFSWQLPTFLLSAYFSPAVSGFYDLGNKLLRIPMNMAGVAISQAFLPRAAVAHSDGSLRPLVESVLERLVFFSLFPLLILSLVSKDLFVIAFGAEWQEAGVYTQILSLWMFFWFISSPLSNLFTVLERQEVNLRLDIVIFTTRWIALTIGGLMSSARLALILFAISGVLVYGYLCLAILKISGVSWWFLARLTLKNLAAFVPCALIYAGLELMHASSWLVVMVGGLEILLYYGWMLWKRGWSVKLQSL